ncbi:uncharacterized protein B0P05DRAFT_576610 [Gilbertella persicaria]|uniref:uncharacterized protein n=1 Tax=Gilbertella persicaria TaxID=101096 RepID=UPI00222091A3|nr:uncharacterized protein B0P05DRAFT_576610 [Gilbertella persicaria]KAI8098218.1 hypothetical protein B0P05DRAFT_576610 [Gilbertella persicaria]
MKNSCSDKICCCIPSRIGVLIVSLIIFSVYLALTVLMFVSKEDMASWSTSQEGVRNPLTIEAYNGMFEAFATIFIAYVVVSLLGTGAVWMRNRKAVRIYHIVNWFFVLLLFTITIAVWAYFNVEQNTYVNDCQAQQNIANNATFNPYYTPLVIPGKQLIAGGSDKSECIKTIKRYVIAAGFCVFFCNFVQIYWARSIGKYATSLKRSYQHKRLEMKDDDMISVSSD